MQSTFPKSGVRPFHVAIIMDGNGRWANDRGLPRIEGHREGAKAVRRVVESAPTFGITTLTLYAFSSDNWQRPQDEVNHLMRLFYDFLHSERDRCVANGIRLNVIGRRDRLSFALRGAIEASEHLTDLGQNMNLRIAIDYSARDSILRAASLLNTSIETNRETFSRFLGEAYHSGTDAPDVDLLIRTGGEQRLSDFLLWECAYTELIFMDKLWPDFEADDLETAVNEFHRRDRRFGAVSVAAAC